MTAHLRIAPLVILLTLSCATQPATGPASREVLTARLLELTGIEDTIDYAFEAGRKSRRETGVQMAQQIRTDSPEVDILLGDVFERELLRMERKIDAALDSEVALAKFAELYFGPFTTGELQALIAHYESPLGRKDREVGGAATREWTEWLASRSQEVSLSALREFQERFMREARTMSSGKP